MVFTPKGSGGGHRIGLAALLFATSLLFVSPCQAAEKKDVTAGTDKLVYEAGETIRLLVANGLTESVFLPGCNRFEIERRGPDGWHLVYELRCFWEGMVLEVKAGVTEELQRDSTGFDPGRYRVHVSYRLGCKAGKPMSQAGCTGGGECFSREFRVE